MDNSVLIKKHHYWRNLLIVLFIAVVIAGGYWYVTAGQEEVTPIPMQEYEDMCSEFTQMEGEIPCIQAVQLAMESTVDTTITDIEKVSLQDKNVYIINFEAGIIQIDATTGEII